MASKARRVTVGHKGFFIVGTGLVLELILLAALGLQLFFIYREQLNEAGHRDKSVEFAKIMLADMDAGVVIMKAWRQRRPELLKSFDEAIGRANASMQEILRLNQISFQKASPFQTEALQNQRDCVAILRELKNITEDGMDMVNLQRLMAAQTNLGTVLQRTFETVKQYDDNARKNMEAAVHHRALLNQLFVMTLASALILNVVWVMTMYRFFNRQFLQRVKKLHDSLDQRSHSLSSVDTGTDEIGELDRSVHHMWIELARKAAQEQAIFDNSSDVICVVNESFIIEKVNPAVKHVWGYQQDEVRGADLKHYIRNEDWMHVEQALLSCRGEESAHNFEFDMQRATGEKFRALWSAYWSTQNACWFCVVHDISEQFQFEKLREAFLSLIARDLESPLQKLQRLFQNLKQGQEQLPAPCRTKIEDCLKTLNRLSSMVGELMVVERLADPGTNLSRENHDIREVLEASCLDVQGLASRKDITISIDCAAGVFSIDRAKVIRLIVNLLANSIKFSPAKSMITLKATIQGDLLKVSVIDQGPGISANAQRELFKPFQQVNATDGLRGKGTGLGLVICKKLVELHGGDIGVNSELGKGSEFWFNIPSTLPQSAPRNIADDKLAGKSEILETEKNKRASKQQPPPLVAFTEQLGLKRIRFLMLFLPATFQFAIVSCLTLLVLQGHGLLSKEIQQRDLTLAAVRICSDYCDLRIAVTSRQRGYDREALNTIVSDLPKDRLIFEELAKKTGINETEIASVSKLNRTEALVASLMARVIKVRFEKPEPNPTEMAYCTDAMLLIANKVNELMLPIINDCQKEQLKNRQQFFDLMAISLTGVGAAFIANVLLALSMAFLFSNSVTRRLRIMGKNTRLLASEEPVAPPVTGTDEIAVLDASFHDIAARVKEARQRERAYLDNSREVIGTLDEQLHFTSLNRAAEEYFGTGIKALIDTPLLDTVVENKRPALTALKRDEQVHRVELLHQPNLVDLEWSVRWSEKEKQYFAVGRDITSRKALERMKQEFIAVVSHDLRSPLSTVLGNSELMRHGAFGQLPSDTVDTLEEVVFTVDQILELINDLLDLEKVNAGQLKLINSNVTIGELVNKAINIAKPVLERYSLQVISKTGELEVTADSDRLAQALAGLLQEIASFAQTGGTVELRGNTTHDTTELEFAATNLRLSADQLRSLQSRIASAELDMSPKSSGGRLRLPLAKSIVECHNGSLIASIGSAGELLLYVRIPVCSPVST